jgi:adenylate cyclase
MFTDLVGYTALMQENEAKAKDVRDKHRRVIQELIPASQGKTLQYFGDGTLSIFGSAIQAVNCAVEIQKALRKDSIIPLRIGLHMGDIVYDDEGVYGDSVNVASRIESMSVPGAVLISGKIYDEIKNHPNLPAESIGLFELKNVKRPLEIYAVKATGLVFPKQEEIHGKGSRLMKSIAVLPFVNMSSEAENEYFSDGVSEEIINTLTKVDGLQVTSRTSSFAFKGKLEDIREIGNKLGVATLLEGSVRRSGNKVRITAQLINVSDGYHSWSEVYDRKIEDIFEVQDEIAQKIRNKLVENFTGMGVKEKLVKPPTANMEAYNLFLKGRYHYNKFTPDSFKKAFGFYEEAVKIEPDFSMGYSGMARCYVTLGGFSQLEPNKAFTKAREYAEKAIELDRSNSSAYLDLALIEMFYSWDWKAADMYFKKAEELNPNSSELHYTLSMYENIKGNFDKALENAKEAYRLDPLSLISINQLAESYMNNNDLEKAGEYFIKALDLDPGFRAAINSYARLKALKGEFKEAVEMAEKMQLLLGDELKGVTELGTIYAMAGMTEKAYECIEKLKLREKRGTVLTVDFAFLYTAIGDLDKAFNYFDRSYNERHASILFIKMLPLMNKKLEHDSRYHELLEKLKLDKK